MSDIKYSNDDTLPKATLLSEMQTAAKFAASKDNGARFLGAVITPFSALLVQFAQDAESTAKSINERTQTLIILTDRLIRWTRILTILTFFLVFLTAPLVFIELVEFYREFFQISLAQPQHGNTSNQNQEQTSTTNQPNKTNPVR
jgi:hypothetical protein